MPFKSEAQRRFMFAAAERGEIPKATVEEFAKETPKSGLPERAAKDKNAPQPVKEKRKKQKRAYIASVRG